MCMPCKKPAVAHTPHAQLSAYTGPQENLAPITKRNKKRADKIHFAQIRLSHRAEMVCSCDIRDFKTLRQIGFV